MTGNAGKNGNREQEIAGISRALKELAKELDVCVIALSQLSRAVESRGGDKRPMLSDLRESGSIEQDADMVMFLYRPEYYGLEVDEDGNSTKNMGEVIIAKQRNGPTGTAKLGFLGHFGKFVNLDEYGSAATSSASVGASPASYFANAGTGGGGVITMPSKMNDVADEDDELPPF